MINHSKLTNILHRIQTKKVLVLGDIMLDQYIFGPVERISPEAPIPIININKTKYLTGGAGNVLKNLNSLNIKASFISIIGNDIAGKTLKRNIETISDPLDIVTKLRGVKFEKDGRHSTGVIAQEVEEVLPEVVHTDAEGMKSVAYGNVVGVLIEAIKDQQAQIDDLISRLPK